MAFWLTPLANLSAQTESLDSLQQVLTQPELVDTQRVRVWQGMAYHYLHKDLNQAEAYLAKAKRLADSVGFEKGLGRNLYLTGHLLIKQSKLDEAQSNFEQAHAIFETVGHTVGIPKCYNGMGMVSYYKDNYQEAAAYFQKTAELYEGMGKGAEAVLAYNNIGLLYSDLGNMEQAKHYLNKAIAGFKKYNLIYSLSSGYNNLGTVYQDQGNYPLAMESFNKAQAIYRETGDLQGIAKIHNNMGVIFKRQGEYTKALEYYQKSMDYHEAKDDRRAVAKLLSNMGTVYINQDKLPEAIEYLNKSLRIAEDEGYFRQVAICQVNLGKIYSRLGDFQESLRRLHIALKIRQEENNALGMSYALMGIADRHLTLKDYDSAIYHGLLCDSLATFSGNLEVKNSIQEVLADSYFAIGDHTKAYVRLRQYKQLSDSLYNEENVQKLAQLEYEFLYRNRLDSINRKAMTLTKRIQVFSADLASSQRQVLLAIGVILVLALLGVLGLFITRIRRVNYQNQKILFEQKLLRSQMTPHFMFNSLSVLQGIILNQEHKKSVNYLSRFSKLLRITLENSRDKLVLLKNELDAIDHYVAVQNLGAETPFKFSLVVDQAVVPQELLIPPMLIQPFVENAIEHAFLKSDQNKEIALHLCLEGKSLRCIIEDNGVGIRAQPVKANGNKSSLATTISQERLHMLAKEFKTTTNLHIVDKSEENEQGTRVSLLIPFQLHYPVDSHVHG